MPYSVGTISTEEQAAYAADNPLFIAHNVLRDAVDARWTEDGEQTDPDVTSPIHYAYRAYDGRAVSPTRSFGTGVDTAYFNVQIEPSTIDSLVLIFLHAFPSSEVTVQIADDAAFSTNVLDIVGPLSAQTGLPRIASVFDARYDDVEYVRVRFLKDTSTFSSTTIPKLSEFFLGRGRVLGLGWDYGSDIDPIYVEAAEYEARSGDRTRYIAHRGRHKCKHSQVLSVENFHGLDDVATIRTIAEESLGLTQPIIYIPRPSSAPDRALLGYLPEGGLELVQDDYDLYPLRFDFEEIPLYRELEG